MMWYILAIMFCVTIGSQLGVWHRWVKYRSRLKRPYITVCAVLWVLLLISMVLNIVSKYDKFNGIMLLVFGVATASQVIFLVFDFVCRLVRGNRKVATAVSTLCSLAVAGFVLYGATIGRSRLRIEQIEVVSERLPESFEGFRIVLFSDLHTGLMFGRYKMLTQIVAAVNSLTPDLVVNCGDIANRDYTELDDTVMSVLSGIRSKEGVMAVLGNHDLAISLSKKLGLTSEEHAELVAERQRAINWTVLNDSTAFIVRGRDSLSVTGVSYPKEIYHHSHSALKEPLDLNDAYADVRPGMYNITLSHAPQAWDDIKATGHGDLTLSGHVHSMQTKLRVGNWRWSPAALLYSYWSGRYDDSGRTLYINDGIGSIFVPMRLGSRPEITLIILRKR